MGFTSVDPLPPRTRGRPAPRTRLNAEVTSTPAHAGPTCSASGGRTRRRLYPRARGADFSSRAATLSESPLPPRTRGRLGHGVRADDLGASTPAHAGPTRGGGSPTAWGRLYPRARGADDPNADTFAHSSPLPPRTRGRQRLRHHQCAGHPSTPAHAGPTLILSPVSVCVSLYPRARGADVRLRAVTNEGQPLPPRTRGRPTHETERHLRRTSTPAHAGPTSDCGRSPTRPSLYPRARGADCAQARSPMPFRPLPPRTRGRLGICARTAQNMASTPAHAGPTSERRRTSSSTRLYPRARGADSYCFDYCGIPAPLPPRTRGRRSRSPEYSIRQASTPAHAGPTQRRSGMLSLPRLYPRARGADDYESLRRVGSRPLPPRTRGRHRSSEGVPVRGPSTPAHAGPTS